MGMNFSSSPSFSLSGHLILPSTSLSVSLQLENGRLLSSDAAYLRTCLMPGGNAVLPASEPLAALQEPHKSGFLL